MLKGDFHLPAKLDSCESLNGVEPPIDQLSSHFGHVSQRAHIETKWWGPSQLKRDELMIAPMVRYDAEIYDIWWYMMMMKHYLEMSPFRKLTKNRVGVISMHHPVENVSFIRGNSLCFSKGQMPWCFWIASHFFKQKTHPPKKHPFKRWMLGKMDEKELEEGDFAWFCHGIHLLPCLPFPPFPTSSIIFHLGVKMIGRLKATLAFPKLKKHEKTEWFSSSSE